MGWACGFAAHPIGSASRAVCPGRRWSSLPSRSPPHGIVIDYHLLPAVAADCSLLRRGGHAVVLVAALYAEDYCSVIGVYGRIGRNDVQVILGEWGKPQTPVQASIGSAVDLVHGVVTRKQVQARVEGMADFPDDAISCVHLEHGVQHVRGRFGPGIE